VKFMGIGLFILLFLSPGFIKCNNLHVPTAIVTKVQQSARWQKLSSRCEAADLRRMYKNSQSKRTIWLRNLPTPRTEAFQRIFRRSSEEEDDDDEDSAWSDIDEEDDYVDEDIPFGEEEYNPVEKPSRKPWRIKSDDSPKVAVKEKDEEEHPMRTDEWLLKIHLSPIVSSSEAFLFPQCSASTTANNTTRKPRQILRFSKNGYVLLMEDDTQPTTSDDTSTHQFKRKTKVGKWQIGSSGISFHIPVMALSSDQNTGSTLSNITNSQSEISMIEGNTCIEPNPSDTLSLADGVSKRENNKNTKNKVNGDNRPQPDQWEDDDDDDLEDMPKYQPRNGNVDTNVKTTMLHYHADIHLHKFGECPRMFRGVVTRDRFNAFSRSRFALPSHWFRPVIATFTAEGIGKDTIDIMYKDRGFGVNPRRESETR